MNFYLVDYENVKSKGLEGITELSKNDTVYIFYSANANSLTFDLHLKLNQSQATIIYQEVSVGSKNALDFQLSTHLGYLIKEQEDKDARFYIITKDQGFTSLVRYWSEKKEQVKLAVDLSGTDPDKETAELKKKVLEVLEDKNAADKVTKIIQQYKTRQGINNALMKEFPSKENKKSGEIYKQIKPLIADKKGK